MNKNIKFAVSKVIDVFEEEIGKTESSDQATKLYEEITNYFVQQSNESNDIYIKRFNKLVTQETNGKNGKV